MPPQQKDPDGDGPKVLLIAAESSARGLILAFLSIMSCRCMVIASDAELEVLDREIFDAILIEWVGSSLPVEKAVMKLCPVFSERVVVLRGRATHPRMIELAYRYRLQQISDELWPQQLWPALQEIFAVTRASQDMMPHVQIAQLVFDSDISPATAGFRSLLRFTRQLVFKHYRTTIDVFVDGNEQAGKVRLAGPILHDSRGRARSGIPVRLLDRTKTIAQTATNYYGEFGFDSELLQNTGLELRMHETMWLSLPIGKLPRQETSNCSTPHEFHEAEGAPPSKKHATKEGSGK